MLDLIKGYKQSKQLLKKALPNANEEDKDRINQMISDLDFSIQYLRKGHNPIFYRGIHKKGVYDFGEDKRTVSLKVQARDKDIIEMFQQNLVWHTDENHITEEEEFALEMVMQILSDSHLEMFLMYEFQGFSVEEIAKRLSLSRDTVKTTIRRSREKLQDEGKRTLFNPYLNE